MAYLLDSDVLIQAKNAHYSFTVCPGYWAWIEREHLTGKVFSVEKVLSELTAGNDELVTWARGRPASFFLSIDGNVMTAMRKISTWVMAQTYQPAAINEFFAAADYYLIAHALAHGHTVVTSEVASLSQRKVKIPNVCDGIRVPYVSNFKMLQTEAAQFVLAPPVT